MSSRSALKIGAFAAAIAMAAAGCGESADSVQTDWWVAEPPLGDSFDVFVGLGGCISFDRFNVEETDSSVVVKTFVQTTDESPCPAIYLERALHIELNEPLGDRVLLGCLPGVDLSVSDEPDCKNLIRPTITDPTG